MKIIIALLLAALIITAISCKKNLASNSTANYPSLIVGKWGQDSFRYKYPGYNQMSSADGQQYIEFSSNGSENIHELLGSGAYNDYTVNYHISVDSISGSFLFSYSPAFIQTLNSTVLTLYSKHTSNNGTIYEAWDYYTKQ